MSLRSRVGEELGNPGPVGSIVYGGTFESSEHWIGGCWPGIRTNGEGSWKEPRLEPGCMATDDDVLVTNYMINWMKFYNYYYLLFY